MVMGLLPTAAFAASTPEEALGEIDIYSGGEELSYLSINGRVRTLIYTYYNYDNGSGVTREIPAYCVNPNITGVPQTVAPGESIEYLAEEKSSDPKVIGIVASGYPTRSLEELGLEVGSGETIRYNRILALLLSLPGVVDCGALTLNGDDANITLTAEQVPTVGTVSIEEG